ncbi:MAG: Uncharacterized protein K0Q49_567 [Haloplasmataceae bacterium]|nr:Uncharacterized protein [Haloplasmataceae bacterium]
MANINNYYTLPFYKKVMYKIKEKIKNFKLNYVKLIVLAVFLIFGATLYLIAAKDDNQFVSRQPYNTEGFIEKDDIDKDNVTLSNTRFNFILDTNTTHFSIQDNVTGAIWSSKPDGSNLPEDVKELFTIYYERTLESPKAMGVNAESIKYGNYAFREIENSLEILYTVGGKHETSIDDLPRMIPVEKFEQRIIPALQAIADNDSKVRRNLKFFTTQYTLYKNESTGETYYYLRDIDSSDGIQILYDLLFIHSGYTQDDLIEDNKTFGFESAKAIPTFQFSVKYTLTNEGLDFKLINDSIVESSEFQIAYIDILPYFGSGNIDSNGYVMIPDGSGVLIDFNNNKYTSLPYSKRIYGADNAISSTTAKTPEPQENITLPMYGMNNNGETFIHLIEEGASMTSLYSGFKTEYSSNILKNKYVYSYYRYFIRERDAYIFSGIGSDQQVTVWTEKFNTEDFSSKLMFVEGDEQNYVGMANIYKDYLVDKGILKADFDKTKNGTFNLALLGGYKTTDHFMGIPYEKVESLTNTNQAKEIVDELLNEGIQNINLSYQGWANDGLKPTYMSNINFNSIVGTKKNFTELANYLKTNNVNFLPEVYVNTAYTDKNIKVKDDVIYSMFWSSVTRYDYNQATLLPDHSTTPYYSMIANNSVDFMKDIEKEYIDYGFDSIGFIDYGSELNSSFHKENLIFRNDSINYFNQSLNETKESFNEIMVRNPLMFAYPHMTYALDVATSGTNYQIVDQSIPFVQLVLSGSVDYSGKAFNVDDSKSFDWHKLKAIETGSNLNFTWSYENTVQLTTTEYSNYYSTYYKNWFDDAVNTYKELNELGIYSSQLVNHEILNNDGTVVIVTYANNLSIKIDYNNLTYEVLSGVIL